MDERIWTNASPEPGQEAAYPDLMLACAAPGGALMISGDLEAAIAALVPGAPAVGCGGAAPDGPHAIRIARDRMLLVTDAPLDVSPGWQDGYAISLADDLYTTITLTGSRCDDIAAACTATPLDGRSPSATTIFGGVGAHITRQGDTLIIRVQRPDAAALWSLLTKLAAA
ncbi:hypothetical protein [Nioella aestuarii]|uniref:hypothetical protein n=1 Tax=Nioella aestuarii TaxID=1662864 RepID=UPI003D7FF7AF